MKALREKVFRGWPTDREAGPFDVDQVFTAEKEGIRLTAYDFNSQPNVRLRLFCVEGVPPSNRGQDARDTKRVTVVVLDESAWTQWLSGMRVRFADRLGAYSLPEADPAGFEALQGMLKTERGLFAYICPRGIGATAWTGDEKKQTQIRRRFMLLGQSLDGMRVWDIHRIIEALGQIGEARGMAPAILARDNMAGVALYASLFDPRIARLHLMDLPVTHRDGPIFLNVLRYLDTPQAVALAAEHTSIVFGGRSESVRQFATSVAENLGWDRQRLQSQSQ
jgi:hypothetical protein